MSTTKLSKSYIEKLKNHTKKIMKSDSNKFLYSSSITYINTDYYYTLFKNATLT